jgi:hypothetical protein
MQAAMERQDEATREFVGPWWLAVALLELQAEEVIAPVLRDVPAQVEPGPMRRAGTEAHLALRWGGDRAESLPTTIGELRLVEVDANRTELTLTGPFASPRGDENAIDEVTERLAGRIEAALAREIGTQ